MSPVLAFGAVIELLRPVIFGLALVVAALAALSATVRARRLSPFGGVGRFVRNTVDPLFVPMERRLVRAGGQPGHAPWWTLAVVVAGGLLVLALLGFVRDQIAGASFALAAGPRGAAALLVSWGFGLLRLALLVRVISSWVRMGRWSPWVRWAYALTDWFMEPLSRVIPPLGMFDITPIVAYFGLGLLQSVVVRLIV